MSNNDSFIDEVTEEVRRDRLYGYLRRYGWIGILLVLLIVGGAAWNEWRKAQAASAAQALGDSIMAALEKEEGAARAEALDAIGSETADTKALIDLLAASERAAAEPAAAAEALLALADRPGITPVYSQIATLKAVSLPDSGLDIETRRKRLEDLALAGGVMRLLVEEQLAYLDMEAGDRAAGLERLKAIVLDAEATTPLRRRATQGIVALGGEPPAAGQAVE